MVDISITSANVVPGSGSTIDKSRVYGETVTAGDAVYLKSDDKYWLADCLAALTAVTAGIAVNSGSASQPAAVLTSGPVTINSVLTVGTIYVLSEAGQLAPAVDLASDDYVSVVGVGLTATSLGVKINNSGVQVP